MAIKPRSPKITHASRPKKSTPKAEPTAPASEQPLSAIQAIRAKDDTSLRKAIVRDIAELAAKYSSLSDYLVLILFDEVDDITSFHSDQLYAAASALRDEKRNVLLILHSDGGSIEPAYLIGKTLKRLSKSKFVVAVPRRAKSAATLISLGADEIHMGMISQLGPIDPQIGGLPALALRNALDVVAELTERFPGAADMLTKYLIDQAPMRILGHFQRVAESAVQYAERLLAAKSVAADRTVEDVAKHLVNHYKDHGFVIDSDEARGLFGDIVKEGTQEYLFADETYKMLERISFLLGVSERVMWFIGSTGDERGIGIRTRARPKS